jgi:hypothetical protein
MAWCRPGHDRVSALLDVLTQYQQRMHDVTGARPHRMHDGHAHAPPSWPRMYGVGGHATQIMQPSGSLACSGHFRDPQDLSNAFSTLKL